MTARVGDFPANDLPLTDQKRAELRTALEASRDPAAERRAERASGSTTHLTAVTQRQCNHGGAAANGVYRRTDELARIPCDGVDIAQRARRRSGRYRASACTP